MDNSYLLTYLDKRGIPLITQRHHTYLEYFGYEQQYTYVLRDGVVKTSVIMKDGREFNIAYLKGPDIISLLRDEVSSYTSAPFNVRIESPEVSFYRIPRVQFWDYVNSDARLQAYVKDYYRANLVEAIHRQQMMIMNGKTGAVCALLYMLMSQFGRRDGDGVLHTTQFVEGSQTLNFTRGSTGWRALYLEANLNFARSFGKHGITAMLLYQMSSRNYVGDSATDSNAALPYRHQGLAARLTYNYAGRYFFEFNAGYNGSENFSPGHRFGFFPSVALGYMISEEPFWQPLKNVVSQLKFRGSYGLVGNDQIGGGRRFIYLETVDKDFGSYVFGVTSNSQSATRLGDVANPNVGWETSRKLDLGVDIQLFNSLKLQVDYFHEYRTGIFTQMATLPYYAGYHVRPYTNSGKMRNTGWDMSATFDRQFGEVYVSALANFTFSRNVILDMNSPDWEELYLNQTGQARYESYGYVAAGLFKDEEDIASWPDQTAVAGKVYPGDIRYLDLNCDGVVNSYDMKPLGSTGIPEIVYGFGASASWKGFDISLFFQGVGNISLNTYSSLTCGFIQNSIYRNNLLADVYGNYWTPDNPDAKYPRLSVNAGSNNNSVRSTFWQQDGSYLRLKNAEIGYSLPKRLVNKAGLQTLRFFIAGDNLLTFSKFRLWDPDQNDANGVFQYPINRTGTIGVNIVF